METYNTKAVRVTESYRREQSEVLETRGTYQAKNLRQAWAYYEADMLHDRRCSKTRVNRVNGNGAIWEIKHIADDRYERTCRECEALMEARLAEQEAQWQEFLASKQ